MSLLQDLLSLKSTIIENAGPSDTADFHEVLDRFVDAKDLHNTEGPEGIRNLETLVTALGYDNLHDFLADNGGCIEQIFSWIRDAGDHFESNWGEKLQDELSGVTGGHDDPQDINNWITGLREADGLTDEELQDVDYVADRVAIHADNQDWDLSKEEIRSIANRIASTIAGE